MERGKDLAPNLILKQLLDTTSSNASLTQIWFQSDSHQLLRTLLAIASLLTILRCSGHLSWRYGDQFSIKWGTFKARPKESGKVFESLTMKVPGFWVFNKLIASSLVMWGLYHHLWFSLTCKQRESESGSPLPVSERESENFEREKSLTSLTWLAETSVGSEETLPRREERLGSAWTLVWQIWNFLADFFVVEVNTW